MHHNARRSAALLVVCLALALHDAVAAGPEAAAVAPAAAAAAPPEPTAEPASRANPDLAQLAGTLAHERRLLGAVGAEFAVFVRASAGPAPRGTVLLLPGDGEYPTSGPAIEQLRQTLPAHGWSTWLLTLESPPRAHAEQVALDASPAADADADADPAPAPAAEPAKPRAAAAARPAAQAEPSPAAAPLPAAAAVEPEPALAEKRQQELQAWAARCQARIASAAAAAAGDGRPVALVAQGSSAALLTGRLAAAPTTVHAAALIDPVALPGLAVEWPKDLEVPVMEILSPAASHQDGGAHRQLATASGLLDYRQLRLATDSWTPGRGEPLLSRRLRGWLDAATTAEDGAEDGAEDSGDDAGAAVSAATASD